MNQYVILSLSLFFVTMINFLLAKVTRVIAYGYSFLMNTVDPLLFILSKKILNSSQKKTF